MEANGRGQYVKEDNYLRYVADNTPFQPNRSTETEWSITAGFFSAVKRSLAVKK